ncbi:MULTISPECIES: hypothetical protein [unclassified Paenibacillus]|uniref:hypothetical protein n=1 Tax=unclassified Paenibacillus TaxID=185978 RepID=UPI001AE2006C|nr:MULTISPECIES: hypothetical protein [unclassified Paenibacillus]MBP1156533.1 outer membrane lipoprotein SlyB [Paenibacillus sp. PvP091]MBP1172729.1 outer membrane lipoprotein SlyB [Paenibacillus sp. PvR098]MBP2439109.1 outer membrane lipoprotein SlyB [Paenibacillus sp. PvP052]
MYVFGTFHYSAELELALSDLEAQGISNERIAAVHLANSQVLAPHIMDTIHRSDGVSLLDGAAVVGTVFSVIGASIGYSLVWGPIIWGLLGLLAGGIVGYAIDAWINRESRRRRHRSRDSSDVIVIVECAPNQVPQVRQTMQHRLALRIGEMGE